MDDRMIVFAHDSVVLEWTPIDELEPANLKPTFLHEYIRDLPSAPLYVIRDDLGTP